MSISAIYANVSCSSLEESARWYAQIFDREPDARPMSGLCEWHLGQTSGFQLHEDRQKAGKCTLTLIVTDVDEDRRRVIGSGLSAGEIEKADYTSIVRMSDPDGNLVVFAQPANPA